METRNHTLIRLLAVCALLTGITSLQGQQPQPTDQPSSFMEKRFYAKLAESATRSEFNKTKSKGGDGGGDFREVRPEGGILVGFEAWEGEWNGHRIIRGLRPIFETATGRVRGNKHGHTPGSPKWTVEAKEGYAVAGIDARSGARLDGFQVLFWKVRQSMGRLDAEGSYKSDWLGGKGGGKTRSPLSSDGRLVLGIFGASGGDIDRLGLIYAE